MAIGDGVPGAKARSNRPRRTYSRHDLHTMRKALTVLGTRRLDSRSTVAVRRWKQDLGGDLTRAQETILAAAAQA